jgi:hypothetical protein
MVYSLKPVFLISALAGYMYVCSVASPVLGLHSKVQLDRVISKIVEGHWSVSRTGTRYKVKTRFTMDSSGKIKSLSIMENVLGTTDSSDEWGGVDPLLRVSIRDAITRGGHEYAVNGHSKGGEYLGWFQSGPRYPHKVQITKELSK